MPRLHRYAESTKFNFFDAFLFSHDPHIEEQLAESGRLRIFSNMNLGIAEKTNLQAGSYLASDQTSYIQSWYARTNLPPSREFADWAHVTHATLYIGDKPMSSMALPDLLSRTESMPLPEDAIKDPEAALEELAERVYFETENETPWAELDEKDRWRWKRIVSTSRYGLDAPKVLIVPVRQNFQIRVDTDPVATRRMLDNLPPGLAAGFIHVDGFSRRDHC